MESQGEHQEFSDSEPTKQEQERIARKLDLSMFQTLQSLDRQTKIEDETEGTANRFTEETNSEETVQQTKQDDDSANPADTSIIPELSKVSNETNAPFVTNEMVMAKARSLWRVVEPTDPNDPVLHLDTILVEGQHGYRIIGASRRGRSHAHDGKYREDSMQALALSEWLVVAVADGAGSRPLARVGASLATTESKRYLQEQLSHLPPDSDIKKQLRSALVGAMISSLGSVTVEAVRRGCDPDDMASTLIILALYTAPGSELLGIAQVGDGGVALTLADGSETLLGQADHGTFGGESLFLTSSESQGTWHKRIALFDLSKSDRIFMIVVGTDGVMDDFTPPFGQLTNLFSEVAGPLLTDSPDQHLCEWLDYERRSSFDDRTLVAIVQFNKAHAGIVE